MSDLDFEKMFGDIFGDARTDVREETKLVMALRRQLKEEREKNEHLKRKARRLIDIVWNKALDEAAVVYARELSYADVDEITLDELARQLQVLRRTVREA